MSIPNLNEWYKDGPRRCLSLGTRHGCNNNKAPNRLALDSQHLGLMNDWSDSVKPFVSEKDVVTLTTNRGNVTVQERVKNERKTTNSKQPPPPKKNSNTAGRLRPCQKTHKGC
eukprot:scaffold2911_cov177-Amphora_coffeaeformis.AAC.14